MSYFYIGLAAYVGICSAVFYFPTILHEKKPELKRVGKFRKWLIAHRGGKLYSGSLEKPENTLEAFQHAAKLGSDVLELDVHRTKDNEIVVAHDAYLMRLCGKKEVISNLNFE